jgi:hypothetical protein
MAGILISCADFTGGQPPTGGASNKRVYKRLEGHPCCYESGIVNHTATGQRKTIARLKNTRATRLTPRPHLGNEAQKDVRINNPHKKYRRRHQES